METTELIDDLFIGIDPGKSGALAIIRKYGASAVAGVKLVEYTAPRCYYPLLADWARRPRRVHTYIVVERLFARPGKFSSAKANFELGRCMGELETMLQVLGLPFQEVTPQKWQKEFGVSGDKATHVEMARNLFPDVSLKRTEKCKVDFDGFADALLMAEYARRHLV